jgi:hypothetical protein
MIAIVSSIVCLLQRTFGAFGQRFSNGCATRLDHASRRGVLVMGVAVGVLCATAEVGRAQSSDSTTPPSSENHAAALPVFLAGAAVGLAAHESGHLLFDGIFDAKPEIRKVSFHGIPFFAISHPPGLSPKEEFTIDSAGFWVQHATSEWILTRHPGLRDEREPFLKGWLAFNVVASVAYSGAAFATTGPSERDTRGMADAIGWKEPIIGALVLAPALLDAYRYFHPGQRWPVWSSRGVKIGMVLLVLKP